MRLFTAIPLSKEMKERVAEVTRGRLPVPYINMTNLHVTLNFFGELADAEVDRVKEIFVTASHGAKSFIIEFEKIASVHQQIHIVIKKSTALIQLHTRFDQAFAAAGFRLDERTYYPHVKLANLHMDKVMHPERKLENFPQGEINQLNFKSEKVILYESKLLLHHAKHIPLLESPLL